MGQALLHREGLDTLQVHPVHVQGVNERVLDAVAVQIKDGGVGSPDGLQVHFDARLLGHGVKLVRGEGETLVEGLGTAEDQPQAVGQLLVVRVVGLLTLAYQLVDGLFI